MEELAGKVAVVTGGASGIGLAMARQFAAEGMKVVVADIEHRDRRELRETHERGCTSTGCTSEHEMRIGVVFSQADSGTDAEAIRAWAVRAEEAGFDHIMVYDHVLGASVERLGTGPFGVPSRRPIHGRAHIPRSPRPDQSPRRGDDTIAFVTSVLVFPAANGPRRQADRHDRPAQWRAAARRRRDRMERCRIRRARSSFRVEARSLSRSRSSSSSGCGPNHS